MNELTPEQAERLNQSSLSEGETISVAVKQEGGDLELIPEGMARTRRPLDLVVGEHDRLMAQLVEEPDQPTFYHPVVGKVQTSGTRLAKIQARNANREALVWIEYQPGMQLAALDMPEGSNGRVWVMQDTLDSEYSCRVCKGLGYDEAEDCEACRGKQERGGTPCGQCNVLGWGRKDRWSCGRRVCSPCRGSGWRGGLVIPEVAQGAPVSGVVVSLGPNTTILKLGDRCLHSIYAGHSLRAPGGKVLTVMRESEVLSLIREK